MKTVSVFKKLGEYTGRSKKGNTYFYSEKIKNRAVVLYSKGEGNCFCVPIIREADGSERVVFHANSIKSLLDFLEGK